MKKLFKIIGRIVDKLPKKYIAFESIPDYSDNSWAVYEYMKASSLFKKYRFIWIKDKRDSHRKGVRGVYFKSKFARFFLKRSVAIIYSNKIISKSSEHQISVFLCHGSKAKKTRGVYEAPKDLDYILVQADIFKDAIKYEYNLSDKTEMVTLGYPRNDDLLSDNKIDFRSVIGENYDKLIVWYPTFRQHKNVDINVSNITLPIIHDEKSAELLNECAKENDVLILLKPHFAQNTEFIQKRQFSNLRIINDEFLMKRKIRSYQLLAASDALLTDYSSVYYDYLLKDAPIGLVWEDYDEYKKKQGFAMNPDMVYGGGEKIYSVEDFCAFIRRIANNEDILSVERNAIKELTNVYHDSNSAERVSNFIFEKISKL